MTGLSDPRHCGTLLFFGAAPISLFFSVSIHRRHRRVSDDLCFHGFHPGEPFQQGVPSTSGSVRVACHNLTCGEGIFFWLWHKNLQTSCVGSYFLCQGPNIPLLPPHAFQVSSNSYNHTVFGRMVKKKSSHRYESHRKT